jgi:hypothetical protein
MIEHGQLLKADDHISIFQNLARFCKRQAICFVKDHA